MTTTESKQLQDDNFPCPDPPNHKKDEPNLLECSIYVILYFLAKGTQLIAGGGQNRGAWLL